MVPLYFDLHINIRYIVGEHNGGGGQVRDDVWREIEAGV